MLTDAEVDRFSRHILLREVGGVGQERLRAAGVRLSRLDEAGRACALWLARAGLGFFDLPDDPLPAPASDPSGLLVAADAGRPLGEAVRERLLFHGSGLRFSPGGRQVEVGQGVEAGVRAALEAMVAIVSGRERG